MDVWFTRCKRTAKCSHCGRQIEVHSPMVHGKLWLVLNKDSTQKTLRFVKHFYWHGEREDGVCCWVEQGLAALHMRSPEVETRGGKTLLLPLELRQKRLKLLQRHARLVQLLSEEMEKLATDTVSSRPLGSWMKVSRIGQQLEELKDAIAPLGGVPPSWMPREMKEELSSPEQSSNLIAKEESEADQLDTSLTELEEMEAAQTYPLLPLNGLATPVSIRRLIPIG